MELKSPHPGPLPAGRGEGVGGGVKSRPAVFSMPFGTGQPENAVRKFNRCCTNDELEPSTKPMKILSVAWLPAVAVLSGCVSNRPAPSALSGSPSDVYVVAVETIDPPLRYSVDGNLVDVWPTSGREGMVRFDEKVAQIEQAKSDLNYLVQHKDELDPAQLAASGEIPRLQAILVDPDDLRKLQDLSNYLAQHGGAMPPAQSH